MHDHEFWRPLVYMDGVGKDFIGLIVCWLKVNSLMSYFLIVKLSFSGTVYTFSSTIGNALSPRK